MKTKVEKSRAMKELSLDERRLILIDYQMMKSCEVREKWNITQNVLSHILFFHGNSNAKARGYYHKDLLAGAADQRIEKLRALKQAGFTSGNAAAEAGIELSKVNKIWPTL